MTTVLHVVGARPNFPKAAPVMSALTALGVNQMLVHTGQHYDDALSESFFRDLELPRPDVNLMVGSGSHTKQTADIMLSLEEQFRRTEPELVVVYGDVNSTVAAALVAAKLHIPMAHVEAGLRSFDMTMPEEVNRRITDQLSSILLVTSPEAIANLAREGADPGTIHLVGNPMIDTLLRNLHKTDTSTLLASLRLPKDYVVVTLHRPSNVDDPLRASKIVSALDGVSAQLPVVLPLHPRGRATLQAAGLMDLPNVTVVQPMGYLDFIAAVRGARAVMTDSGGIQEETTILGVPCLTLRPNTERPITISAGTNRLTDFDRLAADLQAALVAQPPSEAPPLWDGQAGPRIARVITAFLGHNG